MAGFFVIPIDFFHLTVNLFSPCKTRTWAFALLSSGWMVRITRIPNSLVPLFKRMAPPTGIEPVLPEWESDVLTARRWGLLYFAHNLILKYTFFQLKVFPCAYFFYFLGLLSLWLAQYTDSLLISYADVFITRTPANAFVLFWIRPCCRIYGLYVRT